MYVAHHATAHASGARIVHACGFDSIPHDLGAQFTVEHLPEGVPLTVEGFVRAGEGPSEEQRRKGWFSVRFAGRAGDGPRVVTEVSGGDPGYGETAKMLGESALCLAHDDLPPTAGQVTPAAAMGPALRDRLQRAGIGFSVLERS